MTLVLFLCGLSLASPAVYSANHSNTLIVLGDSISAGYGIQREQGWVALLQERITKQELNWTVVNASISGDTTDGGLARLPGLLASHNPNLVVIELGGNDGLRGYPVSRMKQNLAKMAALVQAADATAVIAAMRIPPNYGPRYTQAFDSSFQQVAQETGAMFVPFILEQVALAEGLMQDDGIHPTAEAQPLLLDAIWTHIKQQLGVTETSSP